MKFGKKFRIYLERTLPEWRDKYLCYKLLKRLIKSISAGDESTEAALLLPVPELQVCFVAILFEELEKFNDFYVDKEEDFIIRFQALKEKIERVRTLETEDLMDIRMDFVAIHGEMILLKSYSSLNFAGLIKILKKYDKRTGAWLSLPFILLALNQPFFTTEPLTSLVHECEENLEALFPLEPEVVELTPIADELTASWETPLPVEAEDVDIFHSTLAAISTIQALRRPSSTYNSLSMPYLFGRQGNDTPGDLTAENSPCHPFVDGNDDTCSSE